MAETAPKEAAPKWAVLFAVVGIAAGATGISLAKQDKIEEALAADAVSVFFDALSIKKAFDA